MRFPFYVFLYTLLPLSLMLPWNRSSAQYCTTGLYVQGCSDDDYINDFYFASIQQLATGCPGDGSGFSDYTTLSTDLQQGQTYTTIFSVGFKGDYVNVWIDFNDNGIFETTEKILSNFLCNNNFQDYTVNVTIPSSAKLGSHRMRVRDVYNVQNADPCLTYTYGEVQDYSVRVVAGIPMTFQSCTTLQPPNLSATPGVDNQKIVEVKIMTPGFSNPFSATSFNYNTNGTTNFANDISEVKIYYTGSDSLFSTDHLFGHATLTAGVISGLQLLSPGVNYFWIAYDVPATSVNGDHLDAECTLVTMSGGVGSKAPSIMAPTGFSMVNTLCKGDYINQCSSDDFINSFTFNTLSNRGTGCNGQPFNYILYTPVDTLTTYVAIGQSYPLTLQSGPDFDEGFGVWIDYNNNGSFADPGEFVYSTAKPDTVIFKGNIIIPFNYSLEGVHRMRVRCVYDTTVRSSDACNILVYGETEDYVINIVSDKLCSGIPNAGRVTSDVNHFCTTGNAATLTATGYSTDAGVSIQWQQTTDGVSWSDIFGATGNQYITDPLLQTTSYRLEATCSGSGQSSFSNVITVQVILAQPPVAQGDSLCGGGSAILTATGEGTLNWYDASGGGNLLGTGSPFTTPFNSSTTTYWVEDNVSGCASTRVPVIALIYRPKITASMDRSSVCQGETITLTAKNEGLGSFNYQWTPVLPGMQPPDGKGSTISVPLTVTTQFLLKATQINAECDTTIYTDVPVNPLPVVSFSGLDSSYTEISTPDTLTGSPVGGAFSGTGIVGNIFYPAFAGVGGPYTIEYSYSDQNACTGIASMITVVRKYIGINDPNTALQCSLFPNPASDQFTIAVKEPDIHEISLKIISVAGKVMWTAKLPVFAGEASRSFDTKGWAKGTYFVEITSINQTTLSKLIIQ